MRHPRLRPWLLVVVALGVGALALTTSCSQQQEGQRCDANNGISGGDSDCNGGLICWTAKDLGAGTESDICCPADRSQSTVAPCTVSSSSLNQDASAPLDGTVFTTDGSSGNSDSGTDSSNSADSASDAGDSG